MTAPVPAAHVAPALPEPPSLAVADGDPGADEIGDRTAAAPSRPASRWAWFAVIAVLLLAVAGTCTLLLIQWTSPGSGTVAR